MKTADIKHCKNLEIDGDKDELEFKLKTKSSNYFCPVFITFIFQNNGRPSRTYHQL